MVSDWFDPDWAARTKVHDWRNYPPQEIREMWHTFTDEQKIAIAAWCDDLAGDEDWE